MNPIIIYVILTMQSVLKLMVMLVLSKKAIDFPVWKFLLSVYGRSICLVAVIFGVVLFKQLVPYNMNFLLFIGESLLYVAVMAALIYYFGLNSSERLYVKNLVFDKLHITHKPETA